MYTIKCVSVLGACDATRARASLLWSSLPLVAVRCQQRARISLRTIPKLKAIEKPENWPRRIFSGIQPTGCMHLGNYLGALQNWTQLQNSREDVTYCIVDMHSVTVPQEPVVLRENIFQMAATMLACGIDPERSTIFVQSAVKEHAELCWILCCLSTMARLAHLPQYKEKTRTLKDIPLGLFVYPVLQAADIMLYKTTHVPVGEDQIQHIQLAQHLAKTFNSRFGRTFPICHAMINNQQVSRIRSLRDPSKKMSKSDPDAKATINVMDEPEVIVEKCKKAVTDFCSDIYYDSEKRPGVSNLIAIHSAITGLTIEKVVKEANTLDTGKYKLRVADAVIEHLKPIRKKITTQLARRAELSHLLDCGAEVARQRAQETMVEVRQKMGLGSNAIMPAPFIPIKEEVGDSTKVAEVKVVPEKRIINNIEVPVVPKQKLRMEKKNQPKFQIQTKFEMTDDLGLGMKMSTAGGEGVGMETVTGTGMGTSTGSRMISGVGTIMNKPKTPRNVIQLPGSKNVALAMPSTTASTSLTSTSKVADEIEKVDLKHKELIKV